MRHSRGATEARAAEAPALEKLIGKFVFSASADPAKEKCRPVSEAFASHLAAERFSCVADSDLGPNSNATICSNPGQKTQYLFFDTNRQCESERQIEASNND